MTPNTILFLFSVLIVVITALIMLVVVTVYAQVTTIEPAFNNTLLEDEAMLHSFNVSYWNGTKVFAFNEVLNFEASDQLVRLLNAIIENDGDALEELVVPIEEVEELEEELTEEEEEDNGGNGGGGSNDNDNDNDNSEPIEPEEQQAPDLGEGEAEEEELSLPFEETNITKGICMIEPYCDLKMPASPLSHVRLSSYNLT